MGMKLPYYMAYPFPCFCRDEQREQRDRDYLRSLYPRAAKRIFPFVADECDRMEYMGSMIFDAYPDKVTLLKICGRIKERVSEKIDLKADTLEELIEVMLYEEVYKRRNEYFQAVHKFY